MKAGSAYELVYVDPSKKSRWIRRAFVALIAVVSMGEPVPPGGGEIQIVDCWTGRVRGSVDVLFGDDGITRAKMDEDLLVLSPEDFLAKWIAVPPAISG